MKTPASVAVVTCLAVGLAVALTGCGGDSAPTVKIVSDFALQGVNAEQNKQMAWAIKYVIDKNNAAAKRHINIEFESRDNSTAAAGEWDAGKCVDNARSYVSDEAIVGVIGTANSGCSVYEIPILNEASIAMVSPADTAVGLTKGGLPGTVPGQPERYYPSGKRSFFRLVASDDYQGQKGATFMKKVLSVRRVYVLDDGGLTGRALPRRSGRAPRRTRASRSSVARAGTTTPRRSPN